MTKRTHSIESWIGVDEASDPSEIADGLCSRLRDFRLMDSGNMETRLGTRKLAGPPIYDNATEASDINAGAGIDGMETIVYTSDTEIIYAACNGKFYYSTNGAIWNFLKVNSETDVVTYTVGQGNLWRFLVWQDVVWAVNGLYPMITSPSSTTVTALKISNTTVTKITTWPRALVKIILHQERIWGFSRTTDPGFMKHSTSAPATPETDTWSGDGDGNAWPCGSNDGEGISDAISNGVNVLVGKKSSVYAITTRSKTLGVGDDETTNWNIRPVDGKNASYGPISQTMQLFGGGVMWQSKAGFSFYDGRDIELTGKNTLLDTYPQNDAKRKRVSFDTDVDWLTGTGNFDKRATIYNGFLSGKLRAGSNLMGNLFGQADSANGTMHYREDQGYGYYAQNQLDATFGDGNLSDYGHGTWAAGGSVQMATWNHGYSSGGVRMQPESTLVNSESFSPTAGVYGTMGITFRWRNNASMLLVVSDGGAQVLTGGIYAVGAQAYAQIGIPGFESVGQAFRTAITLFDNREYALDVVFGRSPAQMIIAVRDLITGDIQTKAATLPFSYSAGFTTKTVWYFRGTNPVDVGPIRWKASAGSYDGTGTWQSDVDDYGPVFLTDTAAQFGNPSYVIYNPSYGRDSNSYPNALTFTYGSDAADTAVATRAYSFGALPAALTTSDAHKARYFGIKYTSNNDGALGPPDFPRLYGFQMPTYWYSPVKTLDAAPTAWGLLTVDVELGDQYNALSPAVEVYCRTSTSSFLHDVASDLDAAESASNIYWKFCPQGNIPPNDLGRYVQFKIVIKTVSSVFNKTQTDLDASKKYMSSDGDTGTMPKVNSINLDYYTSAFIAPAASWLDDERYLLSFVTPGRTINSEAYVIYPRQWRMKSGEVCFQTTRYSNHNASVWGKYKGRTIFGDSRGPNIWYFEKGPHDQGVPIVPEMVTGNMNLGSDDVKKTIKTLFTTVKSLLPYWAGCSVDFAPFINGQCVNKTREMETFRRVVPGMQTGQRARIMIFGGWNSFSNLRNRQ